MGYGDWLMAAGEARRVHYATGKPVAITSRRGAPQWSPVFEGIPYILRQPTPDCARVISASGDRPYIQGKFPLKWQWRPYQPTPAEVAFTPAELRLAEPYHGAILIEPNVKAQGHRNKAWPWHQWRALVDAILAGGLGDRLPRLVQVGPPDADRMSGCEYVTTMTFREAMAVLSVCRAAVLPEGGLMHAAAAVGVPAVVIFGGFISPRVTGYELHRNLFTGTGLGCGKRMPCACCSAAMARITPADVLANLKEILT